MMFSDLCLEDVKGSSSSSVISRTLSSMLSWSREVVKYWDGVMGRYMELTAWCNTAPPPGYTWPGLLW